MMSKLKERLTVWRRAGDIVLPFDSLDRSLFPVRDLAPYSILPIAEGGARPAGFRRNAAAGPVFLLTASAAGDGHASGTLSECPPGGRHWSTGARPCER
jgi:hypothetical protein